MGLYREGVRCHGIARPQIKRIDAISMILLAKKAARRLREASVGVPIRQFSRQFVYIDRGKVAQPAGWRPACSRSGSPGLDSMGRSGLNGGSSTARLLLLGLLLGAQLSAGAARAEEPIVKLVAEVRDDSLMVGGQRVPRLVPAKVLHEGQEVFYTVRILNPGATPLRDVEVVQRIPQNTTYVPRSASGPGAEISLSTDGGVTFGREGQLTVSEPGMQPPKLATPTRPAKDQDYTHIRWRLRNPLAPGAVALARFRARFN